MKACLYRIAAVLFALAVIGVGLISAQSANQRLVIKQNGSVIGTLDVPADVSLRLGTVQSRNGGPASYIVQLGQRENPPVTINVLHGAVVTVTP